MVYAEEVEDSSWLAQPVVEIEVEVEEGRIVFGSLEEKSAAAHIGDVAVAVEELLRHLWLDVMIKIRFVRGFCEPGELCAAPGGAIEVS
jgi:hypothetical protein